MSKSTFDPDDTPSHYLVKQAPIHTIRVEWWIQFHRDREEWTVYEALHTEGRFFTLGREDQLPREFQGVAGASL